MLIWINIRLPRKIHVDFIITIQYLHFLYFQLCFHGADSILRMDVSSGLASEEVAPEIKLKSCVQNYRPTDAKVIISARDILEIKNL